MDGSPRFLPTTTKCDLIRTEKRVESLKHIRCVTIACDAIENAFPEVFFDILADDEHHFAKSALQSIIGGVVKQGLIVETDSVNLLHSAIAASIPAANTNNVGFITTSS